MKDNKEKWVEDVLDSFKGGTKAQPNPDLFSKITSQIEDSSTVTISLWKWKIIKVAAIVMLCANVFTISQYLKSSGHNSKFVKNSEQQIINNYELYEL